MFRTAFVLSAAAVTTANPKMLALHKILTGESQFKGKTPVKIATIEHQFGPQWKSELETYMKTLSADKKSVLERQLARLNLTRYTTRELADYCGEGPAHLDTIAYGANVAMGKEFLAENGAEKFEAYVKEEAKNANWPEDRTKKFINDVKAAK